MTPRRGPRLRAAFAPWLVLALAVASPALAAPEGATEDAAAEAGATAPAAVEAAPQKADDKKADDKQADVKKADEKARAKKSDEKKQADDKKADEKKAHDKKVDDKKPEKKGEKKPASKGAKTKGPLSVGAPNQGKLVGAVRLRRTKHLEQRAGARSWGLPVLVKALKKAATRVVKKHGKSVLLVGDLSSRYGGAIDGHNSHQSGRDVDVGFFVTNSKGKAMHTKRFIAFDREGKGVDTPWARFDEARNWTFIEALLEDDEAAVRHVFVSSALRARLLAYAARKKVAKEIQARAATVLISPADADLHDDHFHVRIGCPASMRGVCVDDAAARPQRGLGQRAPSGDPEPQMSNRTAENDGAGATPYD